MRLSLVISSLTAGGAERVLSTLANAWVEAGHEVHLFTTHDAGAHPHYPLSNRVQLRSVDPRVKGPQKQFAIVRSLRAAIRSSDPDVVISFLNYTNVLTLAACRGLTYPVIVSERLDPRIIDIGPVWSVLRRIAYRKATRLVAQTTTAAGLFRHLSPGRVCVIPNPVAERTSDIGNEGTITGFEGNVILAVGRLQFQKGFDQAITAISLLAPEFSHWHLVILGEGPERGALERLRDDLGLRDRVHLPGRVANTGPWMRRAAIFLLSSRSEGFPNALCEAMAAGLPVVSTDCPSGPSDIITPGFDGLLVPPGDPAAITRALTSLAASPELRSTLATAAPGVAERFSLASVLAGWDQIFAEVRASARQTTSKNLPDG